MILILYSVYITYYVLDWLIDWGKSHEDHLLSSYPDSQHSSRYHSGTDQVDTQPVETLELDQRASDLAAEKSPVVSEASTGADKDGWEKWSTKRLLSLGNRSQKMMRMVFQMVNFPNQQLWTTLSWQRRLGVSRFQIVCLIFSNLNHLFDQDLIKNHVGWNPFR